MIDTVKNAVRRETAADAEARPEMVRIVFEGVEVSVPMERGGDRRAALLKARETLRRLAKREAAPEQPARSPCPNTFAVWAYRS